MSISLCMIVRNEIDNLEACLTTAADLVDEVVVVDTGSTDGTREIATRLGARVFDFPWCDDFSAARNESIRHARSKWIFWLDADDRLPEPSRAEFRRLKAALRDDDAVYLMQVVTPAPDGTPTRQLLQARLFRNDPRVRWEGRVHEQIGRAAQAAGWELRATRVTIVHTGYGDDALVKRKLERNLRLIELDCVDRPRDAATLFHRATTLLDMRRIDEAIEAFAACEPLAQNTTLAQSLPVLKTRAFVLAGRLDEAREQTKAGLARQPGDTTLLYNEAEIAAALGDYAGAERGLRAQLAGVEQHPRFGTADRTILAMRVRNLLAEVLLLEGRLAEAEAEARRVVDERPGFGQAWMTLGEALAGQGKGDALDAVCSRLEGSGGAKSGAAALRAIRSSFRGDHGAATDIVDAELRAHPDHPILLRTKASVLFARGERGAALDRAVSAALERNPLCARSRAIARQAVGAAEPSESSDAAGVTS